MGGWALAIDFGTSCTTAAVAADGRIEALAFDGHRRLPSLVYLDDAGGLIAGREAARRAEACPERAERTPKRAFVQKTAVRLGDRGVLTADLVAAVLGEVYTTALRRQGGTAPDRVVLTHPVRWKNARLRLFAAAALRAGLPEPEFVAEPVAAAVHRTGRERIDWGRYVAVYDLGGGTFDTTVLRRTLGGFVPIGRPGGDERLGGEDLDLALLEIVGRRAAEAEPAVWERLVSTGNPARGRLRRDVVGAKHALSERLSTEVRPEGFAAGLRITRAEFERQITPSLRHSVQGLRGTMEAVGLAPADLAALYVTGGSSRVPKIGDLLGRTLDYPPVVQDDSPCVALGALLVARPHARRVPWTVPRTGARR
ncbi:hypothetical protein DPM19_32845 [Actinomadura craniellae]|uniref:Hsp70 family protein n=1 Tax=Actinomadura craniellae TaxID=2231787 RepID=A0A365GVS7_9ACTN|nr:Hsp70 family protein [Actinomadura craniellae]RAY10927.1 hypothetical protein DPM19_32845 [Actinomadura craniellae]